jgi:hypothetical protein
MLGSRHMGALSWRAMAGSSAVGAESVVSPVKSLRLGAELFITVSLVDCFGNCCRCIRGGMRPGSERSTYKAVFVDQFLV